MKVPDTDISCEVYRRATRYITITGRGIAGADGNPYPIREINALMDAVVEELKPATRKPGRPKGSKNTKDELPGYLTAILHLPNKGAGHPHGDYQTRSDALFAFLRLALQRGIDENEIVTIVLDEKYTHCAVHEHCQENGGEDYVKRQIERAANYADESGNKQIIKVEVGKRTTTWRAVQDAMIAARCQVYERGGELVEPLWRWEEIEDEGQAL